MTMRGVMVYGHYQCDDIQLQTDFKMDCFGLHDTTVCFEKYRRQPGQSYIVTSLMQGLIDS